jgi:Pro-kumamolisin, activation domain
MQTRIAATVLSGLAFCAALALTPAAIAQTNTRNVAPAASFLSNPIDDTQRTTLPGNVQAPKLDPAADRGPVAAALPLEHMLLQLQRPPAQEAAMTAYITSVDDAASPSYHKWLTAQQVGMSYGPSHADITEVVMWLASKGLTINMVYPTGMVIDFSGTAAQVDAAFHLGLHNLVIGGETRIAGTRTPSIPTALSGIVGGIVNPGDLDPQLSRHDVQTAHTDTRHDTQATQSNPAGTTLIARGSAE